MGAELSDARAELIEVEVGWDGAVLHGEASANQAGKTGGAFGMPKGEFLGQRVTMPSRVAAAAAAADAPDDGLDGSYKERILNAPSVVKGAGDGLGFLRVTSRCTRAVGVEKLRAVLGVVDVEPGTRIGITDQVGLGLVVGHGQTGGPAVLVDYVGKVSHGHSANKGKGCTHPLCRGSRS